MKAWTSFPGRIGRAALAVALAAVAAPAWSADAQATAVAAATATETLPALLARALPRDPQVQAAQAQLEIARERERQARSRLGPSLVASVNRGGERDIEAAALQSGAVAAAQWRAQAARERVRPVVSALAPRVDLEYRQRLSDRTSPQLTTEQQNGWQVVARWELPVGGEMQSRRRETQRRAEAAEAEAERTLRGAQAELAALAPRIESSRRALAQLDDQVQRYEALLRAAALQYDAGRRTLAQLLQLHDARYNAEQRRAEQANQLLTARLHRLALEGGLLRALELEEN